MDFEAEYIEYAAQFSLALLAASAVYFFDPYRMISYGTLLLIPLLFGYTTYISRDSFRSSSLLAVVALMFVPLNYVVAGLCVFIFLGNVLVSLFAGGNRFKEFYSSTTIPLLIVGLVLGSSLFLLATTSQEFGDQLRSSTSEFIGDRTGTVVRNTGLIQSQKDTQKRVIEQTSTATVASTQLYVMENITLPRQKRRELLDVFAEAQEDIPNRISTRTGEKIDSASIDIEKKISNVIENNLKGEVLLGLIPMVALGLYSLQPIIGLLTALSAVAFRNFGRE